MRTFSFVLITLLAVPTSAWGAPVTSADAAKVLVIGIDGLRPDALETAHTPHLDRLMEEGAYSMDAEAASITMSGPGWATILTGVEVDKHGVTSNRFEDHRLQQWPTLFERLAVARPELESSAWVAWDKLHRYLLAHDVMKQARHGWHDKNVERRAAYHLEHGDSDLVFVHFDRVDRAGHLRGYGPDIPAYLSAVEEVDRRVGTLLDALDERDEKGEEDWLILVTTDHGGTGRGHHLGTETDRRIFMIVHGGDAIGPMARRPLLTDVTPTVLAHFGVEALAELDGSALVEPRLQKASAPQAGGDRVAASSFFTSGATER